MKLLRSITQRGFSVGSAGWFTVLKPNTWFPASRLPGSFEYRSGRYADATVVNPTGHERTITPRIAIPVTKDRRLLRPALVVLSAFTITSAMLWWIMHP
jgi:hypothetical protein